MPDPAFAEQHRNVGYNNAVTYEMRQRPGLLYPLVGSTENYSGQSSHRIENRFDEISMSDQVGRLEDTNLTDPDSVARWIKVGKARDVAVMFDKNDQAVTEVSLGSPLAQRVATAAQRVHDDEWLKGYFGSAWQGPTGDTAVPFAAANVVAAAASGLTLTKLQTMRERMALNDVDFELEMPILLVTPKQVTDLMNIEQYRNMDYSGSTPLARGEIKPFMGFRFIEFNPDSARAYPQGGALTKVSTTRRLPCFVPSGLHRGVWTEFFGDIGPRRDKKLNIQVYGEARSAVVRTDEKKCYILECTES